MTARRPDASDFHAAIRAERDELVSLANALTGRRRDVAARLRDRIDDLDAAIVAAPHSADAERALEAFARAMRQIWLRAVAAETSGVLRSPTEAEEQRLAQRHHAFGYERDFQPIELEHALLEHAPRFQGWRTDVVLFSSAQAATTSLLLTLQADAPARIALLGSYFETRQLLEAHAALRGRGLSQDARDGDIVIVEPVACDGSFTSVDMSRLAATLAGAHKARAVIADTTLSGPDAALDALLCAAPGQSRVFQLTSGLKLMQAGLELANVGVVVAYHRAGDDITTRLRGTRTLTGSGLRFADVLALEAPWFADRTYARVYANAVFANNALLAREAARANRRFAPIEHPSFAGEGAPYCVFRLKAGGEADLNALADLIAQEVAARALLFDRGGSFGFRGHRYEVVAPEDGSPPFLRVAMGRREGWSRDQIVRLVAEIAGAHA
jgi:hypothetical protein